MDLSNLVDIVVNNSVALVVIAYFIFKDYKFNEKLITLCDRVNTLIEFIEKRSD